MAVGRCDFSMRHFKEAVRRAKRSHAFLTFGQSVRRSKTSRPVIFLRHDIDHSLHDAFCMAEAERGLGVRATYFLQVHCPLYSVMDGAARTMIRDMRRMGHDIGFHYDLAYYGGSASTALRHYKRDLALLGEIAGVEICAIARHDPGAFAANEKLMGAIRKSVPVDAYADRFFKKIKYVSDSNCRWRSGCFCTHVDARRDLQVLIHPLYWVNEAKKWQDKIRQSLKRQIGSSTLLVERMIRDYQDMLDNRPRPTVPGRSGGRSQVHVR